MGNKDETFDTNQEVRLLRFALNNVREAAFLIDENACFVYVNDEAARALGYTRTELLKLTVADVDPGMPLTAWKEHWNELKVKTTMTFEGEHRKKNGDVFSVEINANYFEYNEKQYNLALVRDITERKKLEQERQAHLQSLAAMDQINRAIQNAGDMEQMMSDVLNDVLHIFQCERAFLMYPCDPSAETWTVPMERTHPKHPGVRELGVEINMDEEVAATLQLLLASKEPVRFGPGTLNPVPHDVSERFGFKSFMSMALYPKNDKPWQFGIHQCSYARVWSQDELRLLQEIGRRLTDGLTTFSTYKNLQRSEERYRHIVETSNEGIWVLDSAHITIFVNTRMADMLGYKESEMIGRPLSDFIFEEDIPDHDLKMQNRKKNIGEEYERRLRKKDGTVVWTNASATPLFTQAGEFNGSFAMFSDITERKKAEEALKESECRYKEIFENVTDGLYVLEVTSDGKFRTLDVNPALEKATGIPRSTSVGKTQEEFVSKEVAGAVNKKYRHCIEAAKPIEEEVLLNLPSGFRYFHSSLIPVFDQDGKIYRIIGISRDITGSKKTEEALRKSEEKYRTLIEKIQAAVVVHGADTRIVTSNSHAQELLGLSADQMEGKTAVDPAWSFYDENENPMTTDEYPVNRILASKKPLRNLINRVHRPNKKDDVWVLVHGDPVFDEDQNITEVIVTFFDVTELKRIENALRISEERYLLAENIGHVGNWEYDIHTDRFWVSAETKRIYGFDPAQSSFTADEFERGIPDRKRVHRALTDLIEKETPYDLEFEIRRFDNGEPRIITSVAELHFDEYRKPLKVVGLVTDITQRKHAENALKEKEEQSQSLLNLSKKLEMAQNYNDVVNAARDEVQRVIGYQNLWVFLFSEDGEYAHAISAGGDQSDKIMSQNGAATLQITGDKMLEEIRQVKDIVVVEDALVDSRTNKKMVSIMQNRTIINVPIIFFDKHLGSVGTGTFGDEGVRPPTESEKEYLKALASHLAVTLDRIRLLMEQKKSEESLKKTAMRLNEAQRLTHIGNWELDLETNILTWSYEIFRMFEIDPNKFGATYEAFIEAIHPDDREAVNFAYTNSLKTKKPYSIEHRLLFSDGRIKYVHEQCETTYEGDKPLRSIGTVQDITERKLSEQKLKESEERFRLTLEAANIGVWDWDVKNDKFFASPEYYTMLGHKAKSGLVDREEWVRQLHAEDKERVIEEVQLVLCNQNNEYSYEAKFRQKNGKYRWLREIGYGVKVDKDRVTRMLGLRMDIDEQKRAEEELKRYRDHLEETVQQRTSELILARNAAEAANKAKSTFLANMSHELRTPLNAILGFSRIMSRDSLLSKDHLNNLEIINRSGEHLLKLINDVLEMARIEAGKMQLEIAPFDLGGVVRDVIEMMQVRSREKNLRLILDQSSEFPRFIKGDESRLRQILINLLNNSLKFTDEGGIALRLAVKKNNRQHLIIEVEDTGRGIAKKDLDRLFEPFERLSDKSGAYGFGLGLAITRQFIELMGGEISVKSEPGKGSTFRINLPVDVIDAKDIVTNKPSQKGDVIGVEPGQKSFRILIAEDQKDNRLLLKKLMAELGLEVEVAENGKECVKLFKKKNPDLIWMDRRMPVMDGIEAAKEIRKLPGGKKTKIIAVTASALKEQQDEILNSDMDGFIRKPFRFDEIYESMRKHLGIKFIYNKEAGQTSEVILDANRLRKLPSNLLQGLKTSLESLKTDRIQAVIGKIAAIDPELEQVLTRLAENYEYPEILKVIDTLKKD